MGLGPVVGVLGAVGSISQMNGQRKAARAQETAIAANEQAAQSAAASSYVQIQTAKDFARYQSDVNKMSRQMSLLQQDMGLRAEAVMEGLSQQQEKFQNVQQLLQSSIQATAERENASALRTNATQQKLQKTGQARGESIATNEALAAQAAEVNRVLPAGEARRAAMEAIMATATGQGGRSGDVLRDKDVDTEAGGVLKEFLKHRGIAEADFLQMMHVDSIAAAEELMSHAAANQMEGNAGRSEAYARTLAEGVERDIGTTARMNEAGRKAQRSTIAAGLLMDEQSDKSNEIFAQAGYMQQNNAVTQQLANQRSQLQAQKASIQKPGFFDYLGAGMGAFTSVAPLFMKGPQPTVNFQHQQPNHLLRHQ